MTRTLWWVVDRRGRVVTGPHWLRDEAELSRRVLVSDAGLDDLAVECRETWRSDLR